MPDEAVELLGLPWDVVNVGVFVLLFAEGEQGRTLVQCVYWINVFCIKARLPNHCGNIATSG